MNWQDLIAPGTVNLVLGKKGRGKSALAYYLLELLSPLHQLLPVVVNFPQERQSLLPDIYIIKGLEDALFTENAIVLIDEGTTQLPAGNRLEELIKACSSLSRQRNQILLFVFHASRDVGSRILRGMDTVMVKEPSRRQIEQGSKDKWFRLLLEAARREIRVIEGERRGWTYVDADDPEFRGLMENPLPTFWTDGLSTVWRGVAVAASQDTVRFVPPPRVERELTFTEVIDRNVAKQGSVYSGDIYQAVTDIDIKYTGRQLRRMCRDLGLSPSGEKAILCLRLLLSGGLDTQG